MSVHLLADSILPLERMIYLNGCPTGLINLVCCPSLVAPGISPEGTTSIHVSLRPGRPPAHWEADPERFIREVAAEAGRLLAVDHDRWTHVTNTWIPHALPRQTFDPGLEELPPGVFVAGDWFAVPSIESAVQSGIQVAELVADSQQ